MTTTDLLLVLLLVAALANAVLLALLLARRRPAEALDQLVREELRAARAEQAAEARGLRDEVGTRLDASLARVSDRLESVQRGLGEMSTLAAGVGDLKRILANVKTRGTWGEVQAGAILADLLAPDQYLANVRTRDDGREAVEFAIRLPGRDGEHPVLLPVDSKFPQEDYLRLVEAGERGDGAGEQAARAALARAVRTAAATIRDKYLNPPRTTDFAVMFLPTEGLYAEVLRHPGLVEELQRDLRVMVAGPTTLAALVTSLRVGFRTLAIEQRATEAWRVLAAVKAELGRFDEAVAAVRLQLEGALRGLEKTGVRTRALARRLEGVEGGTAPAHEEEA